MKFGRVDFDIYKRTDIQTNKQRDRHTDASPVSGRSVMAVLSPPHTCIGNNPNGRHRSLLEVSRRCVLQIHYLLTNYLISYILISKPCWPRNAYSIYTSILNDYCIRSATFDLHRSQSNPLAIAFTLQLLHINELLVLRYDSVTKHTTRLNKERRIN